MGAHGQAFRLRTQQDVAEALRRLPAPAFVFQVDTGRFLDVNHHFESLLGYTQAELLNMMVDGIQPEERVAACHHARAQAPPLGLLRWQYRRKDGALVNVRIHYREIQYKHRTGEDLNARFVVVEFWESA